MGFFALYLLIVRLFLKVTPDSISQTAKLWVEKYPKSKIAPWMFRFFGMTVGASTIAATVVSYDHGQLKDLAGVALFVSGFFLFIVGYILFEYWKKDVEKPHIGYTVACMALGTIAIVNQLWWAWALIPIAILGAALWYINFKMKKSKTYWTENSFAAVLFPTLVIICSL